MADEIKKNEMPSKGLTPMEGDELEQMAGGVKSSFAEMCRYCGRRFPANEIAKHERTCPMNPDHDMAPEVNF